MEEISTSFCFICLLHLANEQGLKLESDVMPGSTEVEDEKKIGDIWDIKVRMHGTLGWNLEKLRICRFIEILPLRDRLDDLSITLRYTLCSTGLYYM